MRRGYALSIILWIVAAMGSAAMLLAYFARDTVRSASQLEEKLEAQIRAESLLEEIGFYAATGRFSNNYVENGTYGTGLPEKLYLDGRMMRFPGEDNVTMQGTGGMANLLYPNGGLIAGLLGSDTPEIIEESIADWTDPNDFHRLNGAEEEYYRTQHRARFAPRDRRAIQSADELRLVRGVAGTPGFETLESYLFYGPPALYNLATMDAAYLRALLKITPSAAQSLVRERENDEEAFRRSVFRTPGYNFDAHRFFPSQAFRVRIETREGDARCRLEAVVSVLPRFDRAVTTYRFAEE